MNKTNGYYKTLIPPAPISALERELEHARALQASIEAKIEERKRESANVDEVKAAIATLPATFKVDSLPKVIELIRRHGLPPAKRQFKVTDEVEKKVLGMLKEHKSGRLIRDTMKLSFPTIYRIKDKYGLVVHRPPQKQKALAHATD